MNGTEILEASKEAVGQIAMVLSTAAAVILGVLFIIMALNKMLEHAKGHRQGRSTAGPIAVNLLVGALFLKLAWSIDVIVHAVFGSPDRASASDVMKYMPEAAQSNVMLSHMVQAGILWVALIGLVAIMRGFVLMNEMAEGNARGASNGWKSFWHIVFGALAMNIGGVLAWFQ